VAVHGLLEDQLTSEVIGNYFEERKVKIERGKRVELRFDFRPKEAPVQVQVWAGEQPAAQAIVAVRGHAPRYAREGKLVLALGKGPHVVRVGFDGRACEKRIEIRELDGMTLSFSAYDEASLVFENCPEAVEPFLSFDDLALRLTFSSGPGRSARPTACAALPPRPGERDKAAAFRGAGRLEQAAELVAPAPRSAPPRSSRGGRLHPRGGRYRAAGDLRRAAQAFEALRPRVRRRVLAGGRGRGEGAGAPGAPRSFFEERNSRSSAARWIARSATSSRWTCAARTMEACERLAEIRWGSRSSSSRRRSSRTPCMPRAATTRPWS
jgi:hypothetical protein